MGILSNTLREVSSSDTKISCERSQLAADGACVASVIEADGASTRASLCPLGVVCNSLVIGALAFAARLDEVREREARSPTDETPYFVKTLATA